MQKQPNLGQHSGDSGGQKAEPTTSLIDRLMDFERVRVQSVLKEAGLSSSGSKEDLRYFIEQGLKTGAINIANIEKKVLDWEPWTHRHYYFVKAPRDRIAELGDRTRFERSFAEAGIENLVRNSRRYYVPGSLKVDRVVHCNNKIILILVAPMYTYERVHAENIYKGDMIYEAKRRKTSRKVYIVELNLRNGRGFVSIPSVQRGKTYASEFVAVERLVKEIIEIDRLAITRIDTAVEKLMANERAISNSLQVKFDSGHKVSIKSPKKGAAVFDDQKMKKIEKIARDGHYAEGAFYYLDEPARPDFRFKIHDDHRLGVFSDLEESESRDVMALVLDNL